MTRKSRIFSALAIAAAGALMITTTAYQSRAADDIHIDPGTGYAGGEVAAVTGLNTTSTGTFRYDAPGTDEDIEIASGDIKSLESAVKALSKQVVGLGDKAKAADTEVVSTTVEAVNAAKYEILGNVGSPANPTGYATWQDIPTDYVKSSDLESLRSKLDAIEQAANQAADAAKPMPTLSVGGLDPGVAVNMQHKAFAPVARESDADRHYYSVFTNLYGEYEPVAYDYFSSPYSNVNSYAYIIPDFFTGDSSWPFIEEYIIGYNGDGVLSCSVSGDTESFSASISGNKLTVKSRPVKSNYTTSAQIKVSASSGKQYHSISNTYTYRMDYSKFTVSGRSQTVSGKTFDYYNSNADEYVTTLTSYYSNCSYGQYHMTGRLESAHYNASKSSPMCYAWYILAGGGFADYNYYYAAASQKIYPIIN